MTVIWPWTNRKVFSSDEVMEDILDTEVGRSKADRLGSAMCGHRTGRIVGNTPGEEVYLVIQ